jgi:hypothetical protein
MDARQRDNRISRFLGPRDQLKIAVTSIGFKAALGSSALKTVYLIGSLSNNSLLRVMGMLSQIRGGQNGLIVDYGRNQDRIRSMLAELDKESIVEG